MKIHSASGQKPIASHLLRCHRSFVGPAIAISNEYSFEMIHVNAFGQAFFVGRKDGGWARPRCRFAVLVDIFNELRSHERMKGIARTAADRTGGGLQKRSERVKWSARAQRQPERAGREVRASFPSLRRGSTAAIECLPDALREAPP
jgi:hypothetical protein